MGSFGARLKSAREQRGVTLRQIAGATRISMTALEALERDDFSRLPGGIFSRAFIRSYSLEVGLDPEATVAEFLVEQSRHEREAATVVSAPEVTDDDRAFLERQQRATVILRIGLVVFAVLLVTVGIWYGRRLVTEFSPPKSSARTVDPPPAPPTPVQTEPTAQPESGALAIDFSVTADCSVQVTADGQAVFSKVMRSGDKWKASAQRDLVVDVDNAGAFVWTINGRPAKSIGANGQRKRIEINPSNYTTFLQ